METNSYRLWILVGISGVIGALSRWILSIFFEQLISIPSLATTLLVNVSGCVMMGIFVEWRVYIVESTYNQLHYVASGFVGSYTTFSAVMADTFYLFTQADPYLPLLLLLAHTLIGFASYRFARAFVNAVRRLFSNKGMASESVMASLGRVDSNV